jgi:IS30 family transposase
LSERERLAVADGLLAGQSLRSIAKELGRNPSTIAREVANNADPVTGRYQPYTAQRRSEGRRARPKPAKFDVNLELARSVQAGLDKHWSPEQISKTLPGDFPDRLDMRTCPETIYQALYQQHRGGLHRNPTKVLRTRRARRKRRRRPEERRSRFGGPMTMICERPAEVADRSVPGHWEGDLIMGRGNCSAIGTLVERTTRFLKLVHLPGGHSAEEMKDALVKAMSSVPAHLARSLTWDQGSEMGCHDGLTTVTGMPVYFCNPASPWQRGTNENTNGLARQYFPKGTDLRAYGAQELEVVAKELNSRPRKILGWQTPADCYNKQLLLVT